MIRLSTGFAAIAALALGVATGAAARPIEQAQLEKGKEQIAPDMGYIYLTAPGRFAGSFIRVPDATDLEDYRKARSEAFARLMAEYDKDIARWTRRKASLRPGEQLPEEPVKPVETNFAFASIEQFFASSFGPTFVFSKDGGGYAYLEALKPGTYIWYGPAFLGKQGYLGQCYCMGTVKFAVAPGVITNLGNMLFALPRWEEDRGAPTPQIKENSGLNGFVIDLPQQSGTVDLAMPSALAAYPSVVPEFSAVGKINNFYGQMIARIAPIDGVIAYDRDRVIDLRAQDDARGDDIAAADAAETPIPAPER
ncbi:MAG: hypothetical protein EDM03_05185 [Porphyrobacter sp. IPPAS B-1204]|nr:MAG: hypothetical protein EDM03_05185 [Porphyrobacter sp. IPPAS B-1204]